MSSSVTVVFTVFGNWAGFKQVEYLAIPGEYSPGFSVSLYVAYGKDGFYRDFVRGRTAFHASRLPDGMHRKDGREMRSGNEEDYQGQP